MVERRSGPSEARSWKKEPAGASRIRFEPALEGLRGLALLGMLCFHSRFTWAVGGFLPIATFFSLSGYLITSLFLAEWERTGRIRVGQFWARRFRRLMPAALLTLAGMAVFAATVATPDQRARMTDDVLSALFYVANWHFYLSDTSYAALFSAPSPMQHFWSLAIEEQFYFVFPIIVFAGLALSAGSRFALGSLFGLLAAASVLLSIWLIRHGFSIDRIYYGSDTRAAELLGGGILAALLFGREVVWRPARHAIAALGVVALITMVWLWTTVSLGERWLYLGGFAAYTLLSLAVIAAAVQPTGPVRVLLSNRIIRWMGRVSYGAYLFHWPLFLALSPERTGLGPAALFVLRISVTFGLAGLCYELLESPIRTGRWLTGWRPYVVTPAAIAVVLAATTVVTAGPKFDDGGYDPRPDIPAAVELAKTLQVAATATGDPPSMTKDVPRVALYGDSTAAVLGVGLQFWLDKRTTATPRTGKAELGCALAREGRYRFQGKTFERPEHCSDRELSWRDSIARDRPDIAVVLIGPWEVCDRQLPSDHEWRHLGDPVLDDYLRKELLSAVDLLSADGALVVWLTHPSIEVREPQSGSVPKTRYPESDPERMRRLNELVLELEKERPGKVRVIDLAAHMRTLPGGEMDARYRPDGTHLSGEGSLRLAHDWLADEILRVYRDEASKRARAE